MARDFRNRRGRWRIAVLLVFGVIAGLVQAGAAAAPIASAAPAGTPPSGNFELVQHQVPVRARRAGGWVPVDTTLTRLPNGAITSVASTVDFQFSGGGTGPFARLGRAGRGLALDGNLAGFAAIVLRGRRARDRDRGASA